MRRSLSYPKDNEGKARETVKQLKALVKRLRKENEMLRREIENIQKPARVRKEPVVPQVEEPREKYESDESVNPKEEFRKKFLAEFKPKGGKNEKK